MVYLPTFTIEKDSHSYVGVYLPYPMDPVALKITGLQVALAHTLSRDANAAITSCTSDRHRLFFSRKEGSKHGKIPSQQGPMGQFVYLAT